MAFIQLITSFVYQVVQNSWRISTILVPVLAVLQIARWLYDSQEKNEILDYVLEYNRAFLTFVAAAGVLAAVFEFDAPRIRLYGDFIALAYYGVLFWRF